ncbi:hypothetical protein D9M73_73390 [compost metagenome]
MAAGTYDFVDDKAFEIGATLERPIVWQDPAGAAIDLTGYTARMQVRQSIAAAEALLELTTENGGIAITPATGTITLTQTATQTAAYTWKRGVYDLEIVSPSGVVTRLIQGDIETSPEVTR